MPKRGGEADLPDVAVVLRERAAHVRRLLAELIWEDDRRTLRAYAEELEARAAELEQDGSAGHGPTKV